HLSAGGVGFAGDIPDVIVRMIGSAAALRRVFVERVSGLARFGLRQVREDPKDQHSGGSAPHLGIERFENSARAFRAEYVQGAGAGKECVAALHPDARRFATPHQSSSRIDVFEVDEGGGRGGTGTLLAGGPP